jgi:hypothetical protein
MLRACVRCVGLAVVSRAPSQNLPPLPLGPGGAQHGAELWVGDTRYEYVDQAVRKALDGQAKAKAQAETKGSTKSFRIGGKCGAGTEPR